MTPEREKKLKAVAARRQPDLTVVLENVHDPHNISAVMRSCDAVGVGEIYVLYTDPRLSCDALKLGKKSSSGTRKWVDVRLFHDPQQCFVALRRRYEKIFHTEVGERSSGLFEMDLTESVALVFGNEHAGVSDDVRSRTDGSFSIPMAGMVESLNISVACAVTLYEAFRQRGLAGRYDSDLSGERRVLFEEYCRRHKEKGTGRSVKRMDLT